MSKGIKEHSGHISDRPLTESFHTLQILDEHILRSHTLRSNRQSDRQNKLRDRREKLSVGTHNNVTTDGRPSGTKATKILG